MHHLTLTSATHTIKLFHAQSTLQSPDQKREWTGVIGRVVAGIVRQHANSRTYRTLTPSLPTLLLRPSNACDGL